MGHFTGVSEEGKVNSHWGVGGGLPGGVRVPELHHVICSTIHRGGGAQGRARLSDSELTEQHEDREARI